MASHPIVLSDPAMLAEFLRQSEFKGLFEKRLAVPPDYAALLFRNGQLVDAYKGGHFSVGGVVDKLKSIVGGSTNIGMLIADLKPFKVQTSIKAMSRDHVEIAGTVTMELQVNPDTPSNILGMMHGISRSNPGEEVPGRKALSKNEVLDRIRPHLSDRVGEAVIGRVDAVDIRGDRGLQDKLQADIMTEVERVAGDIGIMVRAVSVEWAMNAVEVEAIETAEIVRQQAALDRRLDIIKREIARESDATEFSIKSQVDLAKLQNASDDELKTMALNSEIEFLDAREKATRRQEFEVLEHEIAFLQKERAATFENQLANATQESELTKIKARQIAAERDIEKLNSDHADAVRKTNAFTDLEIANRTQIQQAEHIARLQDIELRAQQAEVDFEIRKGQAATQNQALLINADAKARVDQLNAGRQMTPEQILAINAGLSPDVAAVLAEQARAKGAANNETMQVMRDMVEAATAAQIRSEEQARNMLRTSMDGAVGVAHGAGGGGGSAPSSSGASADAAIDCPKCGTSNAAKANFCKGCGHKLRTT